MNNIMVTILTPIYNRSIFILHLYETLIHQQYKKIEWIIVDDGSIDDAGKIIKGIIDKSPFPIKYIKKENGGKHTAINYGVKEANGELVLILDSDDTLPTDSLINITQYYEQCRGLNNCAGVCGLMAHHNGKLIGTRFPKDSMYENTLRFRYKYNVTGDLLEVYKTSVMREFPFPEIANEKFCPESLVWNRIAGKYKLLCFNKVIYYRDYLDGGLTSKIVKIRMNSPIASMMTYSEMLSYDIPFKHKIKASINYWRFRLCYNGNGSYPQLSGLWNAVAPLGWLMHLKDKRVNKR